MDAVKVGNAIKALRLREGYTQQELADHLHVTDKAVSKWERGLSVPDVSIVTKLSLLLNCDVDHLLEGNVTYLDENWQGYLILKESLEIYSGSEAYGKPLVYFFLSYFMLAGIRDIYISCSDRDRDYIESTIDDGSRYGVKLTFIPVGAVPPVVGNTMTVFDNPFVYGVNLTKYFQRAMSRHNGITVLTTVSSVVKNDSPISFDNHKAVIKDKNEPSPYAPVPILFVPEAYYSQLERAEEIFSLEPLYAEPMGNGMIGYLICDVDSLYDTSALLKTIRTQMGKNVYDLEEIARNRYMI